MLHTGDLVPSRLAKATVQRGRVPDLWEPAGDFHGWETSHETERPKRQTLRDPQMGDEVEPMSSMGPGVWGPRSAFVPLFWGGPAGDW